jgi:hypothetical protein
MHTWHLALLLAFFAKPSLFLKTKFLKMYVPYSTTSRVHMRVASLNLEYVHMLHHYSPRILAKVAKIKKLQGIR